MAFEEARFGRLNLGVPESIKGSLWIPCTAQDLVSRDGFSSTKTLHSVLKKTLAGTNWRLGSEGLQYALGILTGRFHGVEREADLLKLVDAQSRRRGT